MNKLYTVTNISIIETLKKRGITLLYPLKSYCTGYKLEFEIEEIDDFVLVNRLLNDEELDNLKRILKKSNVKGIVFDDLGVLDVVKDMNITKILLLDHLSNSSLSVNYYLDYVDSVVVSSDLTREEIEYIVKNVKKKVCVLVFGLKGLMYSRRRLLFNYQKHYNLEKKDKIMTEIENKKFMAVQNEYGTKFYAYPYYEALSFLILPNILYAWYDACFLSDEEILSVVLDGNVQGIDTQKLFLDQKTIYKVGDIDD